MMRRLIAIPLFAGAIAWSTIALFPYPPAPKSVKVSNQPAIILKNKQIAADPNITDIHRWKFLRAFLRTMFVAEGTWYEGTKLDPYRTQSLSYRQIPESYAYKSHPYWKDGVIPCVTTSDGRRLCSACTGAAQWHPDTWEALLKAYKNSYWFKGKEQFSPENQDMATFYKLEDIGAFKILIAGLYLKDGRINIKRENFDRALSQSASTWASFPRYKGDASGAYGQGARSSDKLWGVFQAQLAKEEKTW